MGAAEDISSGQAEHLFSDAFLAMKDNFHVLTD
jgi:hypothetical protein